MGAFMSVTPRATAYADWHGEPADEASAAQIPEGAGANGGARSRLIVVAREAEWAEPVLRAATARYGAGSFRVAMRPICRVGRARFAASPIARNAAELAAEIEASAARAAAAEADSILRRIERERMDRVLRAIRRAAWRAEQDQLLVQFAAADWGFVPDPSLGPLCGLIEVDHGRAHAAVRDAGPLYARQAVAKSYADLFTGRTDGDVIAVKLTGYRFEVTQ